MKTKPRRRLSTAVNPAPTPDWNILVTALVRGILQALAGAGVIAGGSPWLLDSNITLIVSIVVMIGTFIWSAYDKYRTAHALELTAAASAAAATPRVIKNP